MLPMKDVPLNMEAFCLGPWQTNCYVLWVDEGPGCWVVDAGFDPQPLIAQVEQRGLKPSRIILTHAHLDHIAGLRAMRERWTEATVTMHRAEEDFLSDPVKNLSAMTGQPFTADPPDDFVEHGETLELDGIGFEIRHTPGHSPGGITLCQAEKKLALVGATLFAGSIGRYDFPTSDGAALMRSIHDQLLCLPDDTRIYPGHGPDTTIGNERRGNPFLQ